MVAQGSSVDASDGLLAPSRRIKLIMRLRAAALDRELIAGVNPASSCQLAARALELASPRTRCAIAAGLEQLVDSAYSHRPVGRMRVHPRREATLRNAEQLQELAAMLRRASPLYVRGIAVLEQFLSDGSSPAYCGDASELARRLDEARSGMTEPEDDSCIRLYT